MWIFFTEMENSPIRTNKQKIDVTMWRQNTLNNWIILNWIIEFSAIWKLNDWTNRGTIKVKNVIWDRFWTEIVFVHSFAINYFAMSTPVRQVKEIGCGSNRGKSEIWFMRKKNLRKIKNNCNWLYKFIWDRNPETKKYVPTFEKIINVLFFEIIYSIL